MLVALAQSEFLGSTPLTKPLNARLELIYDLSPPPPLLVVVVNPHKQELNDRDEDAEATSMDCG